MLSIMLFLPLVGVLLIAVLPNDRPDLPRVVAAVFALITFGLSIGLLIAFSPEGGFQYINSADWLKPDLGTFTLQYKVGLDGISLVLVLLTTFLTLLSILISWNISLRPKEYFIWLLVLETGVLGVFSALDFILFFLFWEVELLPMYMLISVWGSGRKEYSAFKFLLYTIAGSSLMLVGILALGFSAHTFDVIELGRMQPLVAPIIPATAIFFLIIAAFAVKLPVVPFHTWLPDAHSDAPTAVSVLLAGVLLKMGGYGIIRMSVTIMPEVARDYATLLAVLAAINVVYGAFITLRQRDLKRLIAYSSVSHMGYVLLGIAAMGGGEKALGVGLTGATFQMFTHGTITGLLFVMVGLVYDRTHTREIARMRGLAKHWPFIGVAMTLAGFASLGLPALSGFVGELLVFLGTFQRYEIWTIAAVFGVVLAAGYILWTIERVMHGPSMEEWEHMPDANQWWERIPVGALALSIVAVGVYPRVLLDIIEPSVTTIVGRLGPGV
ncbi:MAG: NADH-quinone oxidoreductase subunit M [Chloroflexi bacterium]|nr:NADH-quinone oxidoreductase subunit M [Chloroflexota bacterium]